MDCVQKSFELIWRCHRLLSGFLVKVHLPRVSRQSGLSANDKRDYEGLSTDPLVLPYSWGKPRKTWPSRLLMKSVWLIIASNGVPYLQMRSAGSTRQEGIRKEHDICKNRRTLIAEKSICLRCYSAISYHINWLKKDMTTRRCRLPVYNNMI